MAAIIIYYSRKGQNYVSGEIRDLKVGNTEVVAKKLQELTGADLFKIETFVKYSEDYSECIEQAQSDLKRDARPELVTWPENMDAYDTVYLGFPNYWGTMPMPAWTFLEKYDLTGKTVLPFCTHEGSGFGQSLEDLERLCPGARFCPGLAIRGADVNRTNKKMEEWVNKHGKKK